MNWNHLGRLAPILTQKQKAVEALKAHYATEASAAWPHYIGQKSLKRRLAQHPGVIAEIKRCSPSQADKVEIPDPATLAARYVEGGAAAVSVLTDTDAFGGSLRDLEQVSVALQSTDCPVLRKDFMIDPLQIVEAITAGADVVLLIVAVLGEQTQTLFDCTRQLEIDAIVEVHTAEECDYAVSIGAEIIGVNNRNLVDFVVDPHHALTLVDRIPPGIIKIAESGVHTPEQAANYLKAGYHGVLIGTALVNSHDPAGFIRACRV